MIPGSVAGRDEAKLELLSARLHEHAHVQLGALRPQPPDRIPPQGQPVRQSWDSGGDGCQPGQYQRDHCRRTHGPAFYGLHVGRGCRPAVQSYLEAWAMRRSCRISRRPPSSVCSATRCTNAASSVRGRCAARGRAAGTCITGSLAAAPPRQPM